LRKRIGCRLNRLRFEKTARYQNDDGNFVLVTC
jgi:hypothetical protein